MFLSLFLFLFVLCVPSVFGVIAVFRSFFTFSERKKKLCKKSPMQKELHLCVLSGTERCCSYKKVQFTYQLTFWILCMSKSMYTVYTLRTLLHLTACIWNSAHFVWHTNKQIKSIYFKAHTHAHPHAHTTLIPFRWIPVHRCSSKFPYFVSIKATFFSHDG